LYEAYFKTGTEFGDEIDLGTGGRRLTEISFEAYAEIKNAPSTATAVLRIYANDGEALSSDTDPSNAIPSKQGYGAKQPSTLLFTSNTIQLKEGFQTYSVVDIGNAVNLTDKITWTVEFSGVSGNQLNPNNRAALILAGGDDVGSSLDDFWRKTDSGWKLYQTGSNKQDDDFTAKVLAYDKGSVVVKYTPDSGTRS
jgi:hypothetical protein